MTSSRERWYKFFARKLCECAKDGDEEEDEDDEGDNNDYQGTRDAGLSLAGLQLPFFFVML